jgi:hypothetical protein
MCRIQVENHVWLGQAEDLDAVYATKPQRSVSEIGEPLRLSAADPPKATDLGPSATEVTYAGAIV